MAPHPATLARALEAGRLLGDGGLGTGLLAADLDLERDLEGHAGCCELLNLRRPELVRAVHAGFLAAGSDAIATNSFCADAASLALAGDQASGT